MCKKLFFIILLIKGLFLFRKCEGELIMDQNRYRGRVKFFNNGWGFITSQNNQIADVFVSWKAIQMEGFKNLEANDTVEFSIQENPKGLRATNVVIIERNQVKHHTEDKFARCLKVKN